MFCQICQQHTVCGHGTRLKVFFQTCNARQLPFYAELSHVTYCELHRTVMRKTALSALVHCGDAFFARIIIGCCCCRHVGLIVLVVYCCCLDKRVVKVVFLLVLEKHIHLFIRLIRTSLREPLSLDLPACSIGAVEHVWESTKRVCGNDCIFVCFFLLFYVSHLGVYRVCLSTAITDNPNSVLPRNCIFLYFLLLFFRLKFSKTPFHVVLSKNKTNTKKKYHFSLLISVSFHSSQFFFCFKSVHK